MSAIINPDEHNYRDTITTLEKMVAGNGYLQKTEGMVL